MGTVFSVASAPRLYNGDCMLKIIEAISLRRQAKVCCSYSVTGIITVLKSVARIRLVKTENSSV
jgi:hypothetical protein